MLTGWPLNRIYKDTMKTEKDEGYKTKNSRIICVRCQCLTLEVFTMPRGEGLDNQHCFLFVCLFLLKTFMIPLFSHLRLEITGLYCISEKLLKEVNKHHQRVK